MRPGGEVADGLAGEPGDQQPGMSQRVMVLFKEIKEEKLYEPENNPLANNE